MKSLLIFSFILISLLGNVSDCKSESPVKHIMRVWLGTHAATAIAYIPIYGIFWFKGTENAVLNAFKPSIFGGAVLVTTMGFFSIAKNKNMSEYIMSRKLSLTRGFGTMGVTTCCLLGINKLLEKKYGQKND